MGFLSSVVGAFGKGKDKESRDEQQSGFRTLPKEIQDLMMGDVYSRVKGLLDQPNPYTKLRRPMNAEDFDPVFGSKSRMDYAGQMMKDSVAPPSESSLASLKNGVPAMNSDLYAKNPAYRKAWDDTLARHKEQFGMGYRADSDLDVLKQSILRRMGV